jgi:PAS domain-containing protein
MNGISKSVNGSGASASGHAASRAVPWAGHSDRVAVAAAWERFTAGENTVRGVRPDILISWYRCREEYQVDPWLTRAPPAPEKGGHTLQHDIVFAELGGLAARASQEAEAAGGIVTVADSDGRVLASWGHPGTLRRAAESNLAPWAAWAEWASGTNGMGTALENRHPVLVQGPEHWCKGFHDWSCAGTAVRDVVTGEPLAVLNVSCHRAELPEATGEWLRKATAAIRDVLLRGARRSGDELLAVFLQAASRTSGAVAALDVAGKVLAANEKASPLLGVPAHAPVTDPARRWVSHVPELASLAAQSAAHARRDPQWRGSANLYIPFTGSLLPVKLHPVFSGGELLGLLLTDEPSAGEPLALPGCQRRKCVLPDRIVARRGDRLVMLAPREVRFAEASGNTVWLRSDQGSLQAATQGLDNLEQQLAADGFFRVHRRYLVNLMRVREVEPGFKGALFVITDVRAREAVPVSRRHAPQLKQALGL